MLEFVHATAPIHAQHQSEQQLFAVPPPLQQFAGVEQSAHAATALRAAPPPRAPSASASLRIVSIRTTESSTSTERQAMGERGVQTALVEQQGQAVQAEQPLRRGTVQTET